MVGCIIQTELWRELVKMIPSNNEKSNTRESVHLTNVKVLILIYLMIEII